MIVAVVIGVAVGVTFTTVVVGVGVSHQACAQGEVVGWSGNLAAIDALGVPPPGGLVNWTFFINNSASGGSEWGGTTAPVNSTEVDLTVQNWTAVAETPVTESGWGHAVACPAFQILPPSPAGGSCLGCVLAPGVPGGVGERTAIPQVGFRGSTPTPLLNGSYPSTPLGTFSWSIVDGDLYTNFGNLTGFSGYAYQPKFGGPYAGLAIHASIDEVGFGIPIHFLNGTELTIPSGAPQGLLGGNLEIQVTYIFPGIGGNSTWAMYAAGGGSDYPLGGYLFEQLN